MLLNRMSMIRHLRDSKTCLILTVTAIHLLLNVQPAKAGNIFNAMDDLVSLGGSGRERNWQACVLHKNQDIEQLDYRTQLLSKDVAAQISKINSINSEAAALEKNLQQAVELKRTAFVLVSSLNEIWGKQGRLEQLMLELKAFMKVNPFSQETLESWRDALNSIRKGLQGVPKQDADLLFNEVDVATASNSTLIIDTYLKLLESADLKTLEKMRNEWSSYMVRMDAYVQSLVSRKAEIDSSLPSLSAQLQTLQDEHQSVSNQLGEARNRHCGTD